MSLDERSRRQAFLVIDERELGRKRTLNGQAIQRMAALLMPCAPS